ncbi:hypothetical protein [Streptococcus suis]|uniref:hypothetical protein n=1 Tax=Streptococcus suis TaxID=1307 RepID=UPI00040B1C32|nr:hypothetical protein [Streptococcus suis]
MVSKSNVMSIIHQVGYRTSLPDRWDGEKLCTEVFKSGQNFVFDLLDVGFYSDGPIYFVTDLFSSTRKTLFGAKRDLFIFTTFGNAYEEKGRNESDVIFNDAVQIYFEEQRTVSPKDLDSYYSEMREKFDKGKEVKVYHVLYYQEKQLTVDVYCEVKK